MFLSDTTRDFQIGHQRASRAAGVSKRERTGCAVPRMTVDFDLDLDEPRRTSSFVSGCRAGCACVESSLLPPLGLPDCLVDARPAL